MTLLAVDRLSVRLGTRDVLRGISLSVDPGEFVGLIGPNGAGKTSLLRAALGLIPSSGQVRFDGQDSGRLAPVARARLVAYLAQDREIAWDVPVDMVVGLGRAPYRQSFATPSPDDLEAIESAMRRMDVIAFRHRVATELSGGEKARVLIARALAQDTPLLLADEPTAGLDPAHQIVVMRLFAELARQGRGIVASLHDLSLAARWCTRIVVLADGAVVADGGPEDILSEELLRTVYGVTAYRGRQDGAPIIQPIDIVQENQG